MKTILAAVDFSAASHNAARYATQLAKAFNARLILINAYQPLPVPVTDLMVTIAPQDTEEASLQEMKNEMDQLDPTGSLNIRSYCCEGRANDVIIETADEWEPDIIIVGMKKSKTMRRLFGSTVTSLIGKFDVPLLVVPEEAVYTTPKAIALATDADINIQSNRHVIDALCDIAQQFASTLYMVRIVRDEFEEAFEMRRKPLQLTQLVDKLNPEYVYPHGENVPKTLHQFIDIKQVNILAMIAHHHSTLDRLFQISTTRAMTFETPVPLLIISEL